jgi:hypothetical protein
MTTFQQRIEEYRNRAEELRMIAGTMHDKEARATMQRIAADYDKMTDKLKCAAKQS